VNSHNAFAPLNWPSPVKVALSNAVPRLKVAEPNRARPVKVTALNRA